jgi:hypothetical protein
MDDLRGLFLAGPAFEGEALNTGHTRGDQVQKNGTRLNLIMTVGMVKPMGICGSGLINIVPVSRSLLDLE